MSTEFFSVMEQVEKKAKTIKFLEGSHPELFEKYHGEAKMLLFSLNTMEKKIAEDLKKKSQPVESKPLTKKKSKNGGKKT